MKKIKTNFKKLTLLLALFIMGGGLNAQLAMTRSIFNGAYTPIVGGTTSTATGDDADQINIPVGFTFNYLGTPYTQFAVSTNGWLSFANLATFDAASTDLYTTTTNGTLAPWWDDLTTSAIVYQTTGAPGSQICTVQWTSLSYYFTSTRTINYQVKLYEGTNVIEFWYGAAPSGTLNTAESASIGIKSATGGNGQYLDAVTGSANTGNSYLQSDRWPAYNFRFTPGAPTVLAGGTYNVGVGQTYINLNEAVADINHRGISGPVVLNLTDAQYDATVANGSNFFPILIGPIAGASAVNTTTITKTGTAAIISYGGSTSGNAANQGSAFALTTTSEPIIGIVGADFVTLNNLDIRGNVGNLASDIGIGVYNSSATKGATNNTIQNVTVMMNRANTSSRGFLSNVVTAPTSALGANSNNTYKDFTITSVYAGIQMTGNAAFPDVNNMVTHTSCSTYNTIGNPATPNDIGNAATATYGILFTNESGFTIANNSIRNVTNTGGQADGISIVTFQGTCSVYNNKIQTIRNAGTASLTLISGIRMTHTTAGTHTIRVYNNAISEITSGYTGAASATRVIKGIYESGLGGTNTQTYEIYDNSVSIDGSASLNISSACFEVATATGPVFKLGNNIFANHTATQAGVASHYNIVSPSATALGNAGTTSDNNDLFITNDAGVTGFVGLGAATNYTTVANWSAAMAGLDAVSVSTNPTFVSNTSDLHSGALALNGIGQIPPVYITADLDCAARTDNDLGAYILVACAGMPTAGSISGTTALCSGNSTILTLTGESTGAGISYQWASSTTSGGPYTTMLGTSTTQSTGPVTVPTYYVVTTTCSISGLSATTSEFTILVNPLPTVAVTPTSGTICSPGGSPITLTASGATTYTWLPVAGLVPSTGAVVSANPAATTNYTVTGTDGNGCTATATASITISEVPSISPPTATPSSVCAGGSSQLNVSAGTTATYTVSSITYAPVATPGSGVTTLANAGVAVTILSSGNLDDGGWMNQSIPFNFEFMGTSYNSFTISTNGFMYLGVGAPNTYTGYSNTFPSTFAAHPCIGAMYSDLDFRTVGTINYFTSGTAPNRMLVVNWSSGQFFSGAGAMTTQMIIYETSNIIEVHTTNSSGTNAAVEAIQNAAGTVAFPVTGRNNVTWAVGTPDAYRWSPSGGAITYAWSPATFLNSTTINNPMASAITATTTYTVSATAGGCSSTGTVTITAGSALTSSATISPSPTVCAGTNVTLNSVPSGGGAPYTYAWAGPNSYSSTLANPTLSGVTSTEAGTYTLTVTDACSATSVSQVTLTVNPLPVVTVTPTAATYCTGGPGVSLTASGAIAYFWGPAAGLSGTTTANVTASPAIGTTYTVTGTSAVGCTATATTTISVGLTPTVTATSTPATICSGGNSVLTANAGVAPTYCQPTYTSGTAFGDFVSRVICGTINNTTAGAPTPFYTLFPASGSTTTTLVAGTMYTIQLTPGTYTINDIAAFIDYNQNGILNDPTEKLGETDNMAAGPASTTFTFTVPLTALNGTTRLRVREMDHPGTNDIDPCIVQSAFGETEDYIITITGGVNDISLAWSPATFLSSTTGSPVNATAVTATTAYTVTATTSGGCAATANTSITVNPLPTVVANATATTVCSGSPVTLTGSGTATSYTWDNSVTDGVAFNPTSTLTYVVTGTDGNGCQNTDNITVNVNALPTVVANATATTVCSGSPVTLTGSGTATSYAWDNSVTDGVAFNPTATLTYMVTGTDGNGCQNTDNITVNVNALPTVVANATATTVCSGSPVTLTGSGTATSYTWDNSVTDGLAFNPTSTLTYVVTGTDGNGCQNTDNITVNVNALPTVVANATATTVCSGSPVTLTGSGTATSYAWDNSVADGVAFNPTTTLTYIVTGTDGNGCQNTDNITVNVNALPTVTLNFPTDTVCVNGGNFNLTGESPSGGVWSGSGVTGSVLDPTVPGVGFDLITYMFTDVNGCSAQDTSSLWIDVCNGIVDPVSLINLNVYPNPNNGHFTLEINNANGNGILEITDALGQVISSERIVTVNGSMTKEIDLGVYASGIYFVHFTTSTESTVQKMTIQR